MFKALVGIIAAGVVVYAAMNYFFSQPLTDNPQELAWLAGASGDHQRAAELYQQLRDADFWQLYYHRRYVKSYYDLKKADPKTAAEIANLAAEYTKYSKDVDPNIADAGYYGLGYYHYLRDDSAAAAKAFQSITDNTRRWVNVSFGDVRLGEGKVGQAKELFRREIEHRGAAHVAGAKLSRILFAQRDFDALEQLLSNSSAAAAVPVRIVRLNHASHRRWGTYLVSLFDMSHATKKGLLAAAFILIAWFVYLQKLDVFEPEKLRYLLITLAGGMIGARVCLSLYDAAGFYFNFHLNGQWANDLLYCIAGIGLIEETVKIIPFLLMLHFSKQVNESIDYVIYACVSALGFAFVENLGYFNDSQLDCIIGRALACSVGHMAKTSMIVYGIIYAKYRLGGRHVLLCGLVGFLAACVVHGVYDFWLIVQGPLRGLWVFSILVWMLCATLLGSLIRNALNRSEFNLSRKKLVQRRSVHLAWFVAGLVMLQYALISYEFGASAADRGMMPMAITSLTFMAVIFAHLGKIEIEPDKWVGFFPRRKKKK